MIPMIRGARGQVHGDREQNGGGGEGWGSSFSGHAFQLGRVEHIWRRMVVTTAWQSDALDATDACTHTNLSRLPAGLRRRSRDVLHVTDTAPRGLVPSPLCSGDSPPSCRASPYWTTLGPTELYESLHKRPRYLRDNPLGPRVFCSPPFLSHSVALVTMTELPVCFFIPLPTGL